MSDTVLQQAVMQVIADDSQFAAAMARVISAAEKAEQQAVRSAGQASSAMSSIGKGAAQGAQQVEATVGVTERALQRLRLELARQTLDQGSFAKLKGDLKGISDVRYDALVAGLREVSRQQELAAESAKKDAQAKREQADADRALITLERELLRLKGDRAAIVEFDAKQAGLKPEQYAPYIAQIKAMHAANQAAAASARQTAQSIQFVGISAKQAETALRQLPAQFTDIFTSLAAGQNPLIVMLQQVGQIKDQFGGLGNAIRAMLSAFTPMTAAVTAGVAAVSALTYAFKGAGDEQQAFRRSLLLTGNAAGTTLDALNSSAAAIGNVVGTQAKAAETLAALASTGRVAAKDLEALAEAAIRLEREGGPAVKDTVAQFAELGKSPTQAAIKLNEATRALTLAQIDQIRSLEAQGRTREAASVAQRAFAEASAQSAKQLEADAGTVERAWKGVKDLFKGVGDAILNIGRPSGLKESVLAATTAVAGFRKELEGIAANDNGPRAQWLRTEIARLDAYIAKNNEAAQAAKALGDAQAAAASSAAGSLTDLEINLRTPKQELDEARAKIEAYGRALKEGGADAREYALINKRIADVLRETGYRSEYTAQQVAQAQARIAAAAALANEQLNTKTQALQAQRASGLIDDIELTRQLTRANLEAIAAEQQRIEQSIRAVGALGPRASAQITALQGQLQTLAEKAASTGQALLDAIGLAKQKALLEQTKQVVEFQEQQAAAQEGVSEAFLGASAAASQYAKSLAEAAYAQDREIGLLRFSGERRETYNRLLRIELELRQKIAALMAIPVRTDNDIALRDRAIKELSDAAQAAGAKVSEQVTREFRENGAAQIANDLSEALQGGADSGIRYIRNLFKREAFKIYLDPIIKPLAQGLASMLPSLGGSSGLFGAAGSLLGSSSPLGAFSYLTGTGVGNPWGAFATSGVGQSLGLSTLVEDAAGNIFTQVSSFGGALASAIPYIGAFAAALDVIKGLDSSGTPHFGGYFATNPNGTVNTAYGAGESNRRAEFDSMVRGIVQPVGAALNNLVDTLKLGNRFAVAGTFKAEDAGKDGAWGVIQLLQAGGVNVTRRADGTLAADAQQGFTEFAALLGTSVREALDQLDLPGWADSVIAGLDESAKTEEVLAAIDSIIQTQRALVDMSKVFASIGGVFSRIAESSTDAQKALADVFGGVDALSRQSATYYDAFYTDAEKAARSTRIVTAALADVGLAVPDSRDAFRSLVEAQDLTTESGRQTFKSLLDIASIFAELHPIIDLSAEAEKARLAAEKAAAEAAAEAARRAAEIARERESLELRLLKAQGNLTEIREREIAGLDESNRALLRTIFTLEDTAAASAALDNIADAAERLVEVSEQVNDSISALQQYGDGLRSALASLQDDMDSLRDRAASAVSEAIGDVRSALSALSQGAQDASRNAQDMLSQLRSAESRVADIAARIADAIEAQRSVVSEASSAVLGEIGELRSASEGAVSAAAEMMRALESAQGAVADIAARIASAIDTQRGVVASRRQDVLGQLGALQGAADTAQGGVEAARQRITSAFLAAQERQRAAAERLAEVQGRTAAAADTLASTMVRLTEDIGDYLTQLAGSSDVGTPGSRLGAARALFASTAASARAGDADAAARLVDSARALIDASRSGSVSGAQFDADVRLVQGTLNNLRDISEQFRETTNTPGADTSLAQAQAELAAAQAELDRLRAIALEAGADMTDAQADLLGQWREAQAAATAAVNAFNAATATAAAAGIVQTSPGGFAEAMAAFVNAQADLQSLIDRAAGIEFPAADDIFADYAEAVAEVEKASTDLTGAQAAAAAAATTLAAALSSAAALGITEQEALNFSGAIDAFIAARGEFDALLTRAAGVQFPAAEDIFADYQQALLGVETASVNYTLAQNAAEKATLRFESALLAAAAAGVTAIEAQTFGDSLDALREAQSQAAIVGANLAVQSRSIADEYEALVPAINAAQEALNEFGRRTGGIDLTVLGQLDPLGDLLEQYATATRNMQEAQAEQARANATEQWVDIGGGFQKWASSGGAVAVAGGGIGTTIFGKDGRVVSEGGLKAFVADHLAAGNLALLYNEALAFGISSADLERLTGAGNLLRDWAVTQGLPAFATGTAYVPDTGPALVHQGERILSSVDNARLVSAVAGGVDVVAELRELGRKLDQLAAGNDSIAESARRTANSLRDFEADGMPVVNLTGTTLETTP